MGEGARGRGPAYNPLPNPLPQPLKFGGRERRRHLQKTSDFPGLKKHNRLGVVFYSLVYKVLLGNSLGEAKLDFEKKRASGGF